MESIGAFEAKTNLSALLERVANGETIVITKHGQPIARLVPATDLKDRRASTELLAEFGKIRNRVKPGPTVRELLDEGRR